MKNQTLTLHEQEIVKAIHEQKDNKDALTNLLFSKFEEANEKGIHVSENYFASYVMMAGKSQTVFYLNSLKSLFSLCGYSAIWRAPEKMEDNDSGTLFIQKGDFRFTMSTYDNLHNELIYYFANASSATIESYPTKEEYTFRFTLSTTATNEAEALQYAINDLQTALSQGELEYERVDGEQVIVVKQWQD